MTSTKTGWVLPAGVGLAMMMSGCSASSGAEDDATGTGESALSGSGSGSSSGSSSASLPTDGMPSQLLGVYATLDQCNRATSADVDQQSWKTGACGMVDYLATHFTQWSECVAVGQWGFARVVRQQTGDSANEAFTTKGTPGCNDASNCPFFCLEADFISFHNDHAFCNWWDGTTLHMDHMMGVITVSDPSVTYTNVHWGSGNGIYTKVTTTPATVAHVWWSTPCGSPSVSWQEQEYTAAATRPHTP